MAPIARNRFTVLLAALAALLVLATLVLAPMSAQAQIEPYAPGVESITVTSAEQVYGIGDIIRFKVQFSKRVGCFTPRESADHDVKFEMGVGDDAVRKEAGNYHVETKSGKAAWYFGYTVKEGDSDTDGIYIPRGDSALRGQEYYERSSCEDQYTRQRADASSQPNHKIDGVRPVLESAEGLHDKVTLTFSEDLDEDSVPGTGAFVVGLLGFSIPVTDVEMSGSTVTLSLGAPLTPDHTGLLVIYTKPASNKLKDVAGSDANSWNTYLDNKTQAATIESMALLTSPGSDDTFAIGDEVLIRATFSEPVTFDGSGGATEGVTQVPADWSLVPDGLGAGDRFRLLFITSGSRRPADSSDIGHYNGMVQDKASSGHADVQAHASTFRVLASTESVDARDNTGTTHTNDDMGVPIYWLNGAQVADDYADLYDGEWDQESPARYEDGSSVALDGDSGNQAEIYTGSNQDGTVAIGNDGDTRALGNSTNDWVMVGTLNSSSGGPLSSKTIARGEWRRFYGLSGVFEVDPEPVNIPCLKLRVNSPDSGATRNNPCAAYDWKRSETHTQYHLFTWTVEEGYADADGFWISNGELEKNGATFKVQATDANLRNTSFYPSDIYVDGIRPTLVSAETSPRGTQVELTFREDIRSATATVSVDGRDETLASDSISGKIVRLFVTNVIEPGETVTVRAAANDVKDRAGNSNEAIEDHGVENNTVPPAVSSVEITSDPGEDDTYAIGDKVRAKVEFAYSVVVSGSGTPELALDIGGETRQAAYARGSGTAELVFEYTVADGDEDGDGIAIGANALSLAGGMIAAEVSATRHAALAHDAVDADDQHLVDGVRPKPTGAETSDDGSKIEITFSENVSKSSGGFAAAYGGQFFFNVTFSVAENVATLSLSPSVQEGQTVEVHGDAAAVEDDLGNDNAQFGDYAVTNTVVRPTVSSIALTSDPGEDDTYAIGDAVKATVTFSKDVTVGDAGGEPALELDIGGAARQAGFDSGSDSDSLVFSYTIVEDDLDSDGIAIGVDKLALNGGTIRDSLGLDAKLGHDAESSQSGHKVDGVRPEPLSAVVDTEDDAGALVLTFYEAMDGDSTPAVGAFAVTVGTTDTANTVTAVAIDGANVTLTLTTDVAADAANVKVGYTKPASNPLRDAAGNDAATFSPRAVQVTSIARVSSIAFSTDPGTEAPLTIGDYLYAVVTFSKAVTVSGTPQIELDIGGNARVVDYVQSSQDGTMQGFRYTIVEGDEDTDGVSIGASKLTLPSGASIQDGSDAAFLTHAEVAADSGHKVDGVRPTLTGAETTIDGKKIVLTFSEDIGTASDLVIFQLDGVLQAPTVQVDITDNVVTWSSLGVTIGEGQTVTLALPVGSVKDAVGNENAKIESGPVTNTVVRPRVTLTSDPGADDTYAIGETVQATAMFIRDVTVTGSPTLKLQVGVNERTATYDADESSGAAVVFAYTVAEGDVDADGIAIGANQLALNGGSIQVDGANALLTHKAVAADSGHRVDGVVPQPVSAVVNTSDDDRALVLTFSEALDTGSTPAAGTFTVSGNTVSSVVIAGSKVTLTLDTAVSTGDTVTVGYTKPSSNPLKDGAGNGVATFSGEPVKVTSVASVSSIALTSDPGMDDTYAIGETVQATVTFTGDVTVTGGPRLALDFGGGATGTAAYASGSGSAALVFTYTVAAGDEAAAGIAFAANALSLNGGSIEDGGDAAGLTHGVVAADSGHKVDGVRPVRTEANTSPDGTEIMVSFNENVGVTGDSFTVFYGGGSVTVSSDSVKDDVVKLALGVPVKDGESVDIAFAADVVVDGAGNGNGHQARVSVTNNVDNPTLAITSPAGIYGIGEEIQVTATFGAAATVATTGGTPTLELDIGGTAKAATYDADESSGAAVVFTYAVVEGDVDADGIAIGANAIALNGGTIRNDQAEDLSLVHAAVAADSGHKVDGVVPTFKRASVDTTADDKALVLTYSEALDDGSTPAVGDFTVEAGGTANTVTGVDVDGAAVTLTLMTAVAENATVTVDYTAGTNPIQDQAGNDAEDLDDWSVTVVSGPPTVSISADAEEVPEGTAAAFTLNRTGATTAALAVTVDVTQDGDFTASGIDGERTVTFAADSATAALSFATVDDSAGEDDGYITVEVTEVPNGNLISETANEATVKVTDADTKVKITLAASAATVSEGAGTLRVEVVARAEPGVTPGFLSPAPQVSVVTKWDRDGANPESGTAKGLGEDFGNKSVMPTFAAGDFAEENGRQVARRTVEVPIVDDALHEGDEFFFVKLERSPTQEVWAALVEPVWMKVTIRENDPRPVLGLVFDPRTVGEGETATLKVVSTNGAAFVDGQTVTLSFAGTATTGTDYTVGAESLTLDAGKTSVTTTVAVLSDTVDDDYETIVVTASHGNRTFTATLGIGAAAPEAPARVEARGYNGFAELFWTKPAWDGGTPITHYQYRVAPDGAWTYLGSPKLLMTAYVYLGPGEYGFEVRAVNAVGPGPAKGSATVRVWPGQERPEGAPTEPQNLRVTSVKSTQADLEWSLPDSYEDPSIQGFRVETCIADCDSDSSWSELTANTGEGGTEWSHRGVTGGLGGHWYRVSAVTETGQGGPPSVPARHPGATIGVPGAGIRHTGATVWVNLENPDGRELHVRLTREGTVVETRTLTASRRSLGVVFENLEMDTGYKAQVDFAATFDSPAAREVEFRTMPEGLTHPEEDPFKKQTVEVSTDGGGMWDASGEITVKPGEAVSYRVRLLPCGGSAHTVLIRQGYATLGFLRAEPVRPEPANLVLHCNADDPAAPGEAVEVTLRGVALEEYPSAQTALVAMPFRMPFLHTVYTSLPGHQSTYLVARHVVPVTAVVDSDEGPVELKVEDAWVHETHNPSLEFELKLDRAADWPVTLAYATRHLGRGVEGAATPGLDYEERSGTLTFAPGETQMTVSVPVVDDTVEDTGETLRLWVHSVVGAALPDARPGYQSVEATGTIYNTEEDVLPALTARVEGVPQSHDGQAMFGFDLHFSEEFGLSYRTLRDAAFEVTGGTVTGARRLAQGSNAGWRIEVEPATDGTVTVVLPAGRACGESGAVCTGDGRRLETRLELRVAGPSSSATVLDNAAPEGLPVIAGTARVGETLTASAAGIEDADGLVGATFAWQWLSSYIGTDTAIAGATGPSYTLSAAEEGKTVRVRVRFTDGGGTEESLVSEATAAVEAALPPEVSIAAALPSVTEGTVAVFTLSRTGPVAGALTVAVEVSESGAMVAGTPPVEAVFEAGSATAATAVGTEDDGTAEAASEITAALAAGAGYTVAATGGSASVTVEDNDEAPAVAPESGPLVGFTVVDASDQAVVETLTDGVTLALDDPDNGSYGIRADMKTGAEIGSVRLQLTGAKDVDQTENFAPYSLYGDGDNGLHGQSLPAGEYTLTATAYSEQGRGGTILGTLAVSFTVSGPATEEEPNTPATGAPTIGGTAEVGETLEAVISGISDADGLAKAAYSYQWLADDADIAGATDDSYTLAAANVGKAIRVRVSFTDDEGNAESLTSVATAAVAEVPLTAEFPASPYQSASHDGADDQPQVIVAFSREVSAFTASTPSVSVTGGTVTNVAHHEETGLTHAWLFYLDPSSTANIQFSLVTGQTCASGGICAGDGTTLSEVPVVHIIPGPDMQTSPATGAPIISGTAQVGETLTVDTSGIDDADGMSGAVFSYQWLANDAEITGATGDSYTLVEPDFDKAVKVRVIFNDDDDNEETLTSEPTAAVAAETAVPDAPQSLNISPDDTGTLDVSWEAPSSDGGSAITGYKVQWKSGSEDYDGSAGSTRQAEITDPASRTYTITGLTDGVEYAVRIIAVNDIGDGPPSDEATGTPRETTPPELATATVDGTTLTLTYDEALDDNSEPSSDAFSVTVGGTSRAVDGVSVSGDTVTLTLASAVTAADTVTVSYAAPTDAAAPRIQDEAGNPAASFSDQAVVNNTPPPPNTPATGAPTISGTARVGETLTAETSAIADADGLDNVGYSYQWLANGADIAGATDPTYTLVDDDAGKAIQVKVSFRDDKNNPETLTSAATAAVEPRPNTPATGAPSISGTVRVGETLTAEISAIADADGMSGAVFIYQWLADDADIAGATNNTYTLVDADLDKAVKVRVIFTDNADNEETLTSEATAAVEPRPNSPATGAPTISGTVRVGETLTAETSGIADADGMSGAVFSYQWLANGADVAGATSDTYTPVADDVGKAIKVKVSFRDDKNHPESLTSAATAAVATAADESAVWSATLTVGSIAGFRGFWKDIGMGELTSEIFTLDGVDYTVKVLADSDGPQFYLTLDKALPVGFTLQVGATTLRSQDASIREFSSGATQYGWATNQGAILADVDTVEVSLTLDE